VQDLCKYAVVSTIWNTILEDDQIWYDLYAKEFGELKESKHLKDCFKKKLIWLKEILEKNKGQTATVGSKLSHGGIVVGGTSNVITNGKAAATVGDKVLCNMHGVSYILKSQRVSRNVFIGDSAIAMVGDKCECGAVIIDGEAGCVVS